ncbi:MAG: Sec-independent protein translocase subunit TatA/TatB [Planctomycetota bacterium]
MSATMVSAFWTPGYGEIIIIALVVLVVFGNRIPEVMRSLGAGLTHFKKGLHETEEEIRKELDANESSSDNSSKKKS